VRIYQFYVTIAYFKFTATESSSGWSPPAQPHHLPVGDPICIDTNEHSLPMVESPSSNGSDNSWSPPGALPRCELPPMSSPTHDTTLMPQTSSDSWRRVKDVLHLHSKPPTYFQNHSCRRWSQPLVGNPVDQYCSVDHVSPQRQVSKLRVNLMQRQYASKTSGQESLVQVPLCTVG